MHPAVCIRRGVLAALGLGGLSVGLAGCLGSGADTDNSTKPRRDVNTDAASLGNVTFTMLDIYGGAGPEAQWMREVVATFQRTYGNLTVKRSTETFDDLLKTLNLRMSGNNPPDVVPANNGWQSLGVLVKAGQVLNLDGYSKAYGWDRRIPKTIQRMHAFSADGLQMGTGPLFGVPPAHSAIIGVYYNRTKLAALGLEAPTTLTDFEDAAAAAKDAGEVPIQFGTLEQVPGLVPLFALQDAYGDQKKITDYIYSQGDITLADTGMPEAAETLRQWAERGWFTPNFSGISSGDAGGKFTQGTGVFRFDYSGSVPFEPDQRKDFGFFLLPRSDGGTPVATGSGSWNYSIGARAADPDAVAAFLDFLTGKTTAELAVQHGLLPMIESATPEDADPLFTDEVTAQRSLDENDAYVPYLDWSSPTFLDTMGQETQLLLGGKSSPDDLVATGQEDYDKARNERE